MIQRNIKKFVFPAIFCLFLLIPHAPGLASGSDAVIPLIHDDPSELILPVAFFTDGDDGFILIDAGNNAGVIKRYDESWSLRSSDIACIAGENNIPTIKGFNPFGAALCAQTDDGLIFAQKSKDGPVVSRVRSGDVSSSVMDDKRILHPVSGNGPARLFDADGLYDLAGETVRNLSLEGSLRTYQAVDGDIFTVTRDRVTRFNKYGMPLWYREFPSGEDGRFVPTGLTVTSAEVYVSGIVLPQNFGDEFFSKIMPDMFASSATFEIREHLRLYEFQLSIGTPLLVAYDMLDGEVTEALEIDNFPLWLTTIDDSPYLLALDGNKALITRFLPGLTDSIDLTELQLGKRTFEGTTSIEFCIDSIYFDTSSGAGSDSSEVNDELFINRRKLSDPEIIPFMQKPFSGGSYFVTGMDSHSDGTIYIAGYGNGLLPDSSRDFNTFFLDAYSPDGEWKSNLLDALQEYAIPGPLTVLNGGEVIQALVSFDLNAPDLWAVKLSPEGNILNEYYYLAGSNSAIHMVAGGKMGIASDGTIYQSDNIIRDSGEIYMRKFSSNGKFIIELSKYCGIRAMLLGVEDGNPIYSWRNRYIFMVEDEEIVAQVDLGEYFDEIEPLDITWDGENYYLLTEDRVVYVIEENAIKRIGFETSVDVESAAETLRSVVLDYINTYASPPDELNDTLWDRFGGDERTDDIMENFFGSGPFNYKFTGRDDFSFMLFGRDPFQTVFIVDRDGVEEIEW